MGWQTLASIANALVANGKGILAADETVGTITKRFDQLKIPSTSETRRDYREMLFTTPEGARFISGVIGCDETIRQLGAKGELIPKLLEKAGIIAGIKVETGSKPLAGCEGETVTEGLDGLARPA
jgi:fructose-bisphosphate aldolase, class I